MQQKTLLDLGSVAQSGEEHTIAGMHAGSMKSIPKGACVCVRACVRACVTKISSCFSAAYLALPCSLDPTTVYVRRTPATACCTIFLSAHLRKSCQAKGA